MASLAYLGLGPILLAGQTSGPKPLQPNILIILADDLGYGDVACYNPDRGRIKTPNLDQLAAAGMRFTDAHSASGVCSPTRYALLTGRYPWRSRLQSGIVQPWEGPLIAPDRWTLGTIAQKAGYKTAAIGKWHLGRDWPIAPDQRPAFKTDVKSQVKATPELQATWRAVFSKPIPGGPTERGFDYYFGTDVPNWPPYCFIENDRTIGTPFEFLPQPLILNHQASLQGPALPGWDLTKILPELVRKTNAKIAEFAQAQQPFLIYLPLTSPHTPIAVATEFQGKSGLSPYADFVMQTDHAVGQVLQQLKHSGLDQNTIVIFTSDNGCAAYIGVKEMEKQGHYPSAHLRGYKMDAFEGGHRVPFMVRWPGVVKAGSVCHETVGSVDLLATVAEILQIKRPENQGPDSFCLLPLLKNQPDNWQRAPLVAQSVTGVFSLRQGDWKIIFGPGSGAPDANPRLFHLKNDSGETQNLAAREPQKIAELTALMQALITQGRSNPGPQLPNDVPVKLYKQPRPARKAAN